jgi:hypothetical protein
MLGISGTDAEAAKKNYSRRKLTTDEHNELRKTTLVKKRTASKAQQKEITFEDFNFMMVIGRGAFGKVFLAE